MSLSCKLQGEGENYLRITVFEYEHPKARDYWDGNWIKSKLEILVKPFQGVLYVSLRTTDFTSLLEDLTSFNKMESKEVSFETMEDSLNFKLTRSSLGAVSVIGKIGPIEKDTELSFSFESDLTFVESFTSELKNIVIEYPAIDETHL